ncbi:MAG: ZIP family metal transporter [Alphaproteobacteria bacterium]|nr:ZIP family metal transporter [Alphaproteobacteria bacterium]
MDRQVILIGFGASVAAGMATGLGAALVLFVRRISDALNDGLLGFAAGVMLAASFFSLIIPGMQHAEAGTGSKVLAALIVIVALLAGAAAIAVMNRYAPHEHFLLGPKGVDARLLQRIWLFVIAITLHNFPEGLAVGVGFGSGDLANGTALAIGIGLQNIPEGLAVAVALLSLGYSRLAAFSVGAATGLVEPVGGLLGVAAVTVFQPLLPWGLGFAAGAMLFVVSNEIVPETHRRGHEGPATFGLMIGLVLMMFLDVVLTK